jgi:hypothetical protein
MTNIPLDEEIAKAAAEAVSLTEIWFCEVLDFSEASIALLEAAVEEVDDLTPGGDSAENIDLLSWVWGSYIGEVLRRQVGGEWLEWEDEYGQAIVLQSGKFKVFPHDKVRKRFINGKEHNLEAYYHAFRNLMSADT